MVSMVTAEQCSHLPCWLRIEDYTTQYIDVYWGLQLSNGAGECHSKLRITFFVRDFFQLLNWSHKLISQLRNVLAFTPQHPKRVTL